MNWTNGACYKGHWLDGVQHGPGKFHLIKVKFMCRAWATKKANLIIMFWSSYNSKI